MVRSQTDSDGCDVYIEATGSPAGVEQGLSLVRKLGRFVEFSVLGTQAPTAIVLRSRTTPSRWRVRATVSKS